MEFEENIRLLDEYNQWKAQRKASANDTSPESFMVDRAKEQAMQRVIAAVEFIDNMPEDFTRAALQKALKDILV